MNRTAKISRQSHQHPRPLTAHANDKTFLDSIQQADGNTLWDQQKRPVYYEIAMNKMQFDYVVSNKLYSAAGAGNLHQDDQHRAAGRARSS